MKKLKNVRKNLKTGVIRLYLILQTVLLMSMPVKADGDGKADTHANTLQNSKLVKGSINLIKDATTAVLLIEAVLVILLIVIELMKMQAAEQEEKPKHKKTIKSIAIAGILIVSVTAIVPIVLSYYN